MRIITPVHVSLINQQAHTLFFEGQHGESFRVSVLDHDLIRIQHLPGGQPRLDRTWSVVGPDGETPLQGRPRDDLSPFPLPPFAVETDEHAIQLPTEKLRLVVHTDSFHLSWQTPGGEPFAADLPNRAYAYDRAGRAVFHYLKRQTGEHYYGFGERAGALDKAGRRMRMMNVDALGYDAESSDPLYKHIPFYITFVPEMNIAYGLFYDNPATCVFDMGREIDAFWGFYRYYQADDGDLDYYMIYGPTIEAVVEKYTALTGRPLLPPRWSLGYLGSTMRYTEAANAQEQLKQFVTLCREHDIPCDMFQMSSGYTTDSRGARYVFTWNRDKVPEPDTMTRHFHEAGMHVGANVKPYLLTSHPRYAEVAASGGFITEMDSPNPIPSTFWSGGAFESGEGAYVDFTSPAGYEWWKARLKEALFSFGIDVIWNDNNEFEIWDDAARCSGFGSEIPVGLARPLQTLLMGRASYEATREYYADRRPFVLTRAGSAGIQRYAQTWSGDNTTSWHTLRYNIPMGLGLSLSGMPNTGHDVGGFYGPAPDAELFVRWVQNGIFHPRFTIHSWNTDGSASEPWMHPEVLPIVREAIRFRYRLLPYMYTLFHEAAAAGHPIIRPLVYHFPHDAHCRTESFDFMLGPNLLVASVLEPGARERSVYLPQGRNWCDFYTGQWYAGGQTIQVDAPLAHVPLMVPANGMIPMGRVMRHVGELPDDLRQVYIFPHPEVGEGIFTLIEDDGASLDYLKGVLTRVVIKVSATASDVRVTIEPPRGGYALPYNAVEIVTPAGEKRAIHAPAINGHWTDEAGRQHILVAVPAPNNYP